MFHEALFEIFTDWKCWNRSRLKSDNRSLNNNIAQLRDKVKRLSRNRGPESALKFGEDKPTKLLKDDAQHWSDEQTDHSKEEKERKEVVEDEVVAVDATDEQATG